MRATRNIFVFVTLPFCVIFLSLTSANAQTAVNYRFLEVIDMAGKPVADAKVETVGSGGNRPYQTDEKGTVSKLPFYYGDFHTTGFKVSKPGYVTHEESIPPDDHLYSKLLYGEVPQYDSKNLKVVLLKLPVTERERKAFEAEQRKRELLRAVRWGDPAMVEKLLEDGASATATDVRGIPAILWAVAIGDKRKIEALLNAGADVRDKKRSGRKALLYYMYNLKHEYDEEVMRALIKRGADVNAVDEDETILSLAKRYSNARIVKLLEDAGAR